MVKVRGKLVDMLIELDPTHADHVETTKDGKKVLCLEVKRAICGMLQSALLFCQKLRADLEKEGFTVNPCDACTANKMIAGSQCAVVWHVDDLKVSHANPKVVDSFIRWIERNHGDPKLGKVKAKRGKVHDYLGMTLDFSEKWKVKIDQTKSIKQMIKEFPEPIRTTADTPAA